MIQCFVARYDEKMQINHLLPTAAPFELHYMLVMDPADLEFWRSIGLTLAKEPETFGRCDMEIDMTEDHISRFQTFDRHLCQAYGSVCGIEANPLPEIRRVRPSLDTHVLYVDNDEQEAQDALLNARDEEFSCVVGRQSWITYWAASMGLPVIEILDRTRNRYWLSKWASNTYRMIETDSLDMLDQALVDLAEITALIQQRQMETVK